MDTLYTERKSSSFQLRLPEGMKEEIRRMAEMDGISINSAIVQRLADLCRNRQCASVQKRKISNEPVQPEFRRVYQRNDSGH